MESRILLTELVRGDWGDNIKFTFYSTNKTLKLFLEGI